MRIGDAGASVIGLLPLGPRPRLATRRTPGYDHGHLNATSPEIRHRTTRSRLEDEALVTDAEARHERRRVTVTARGTLRHGRLDLFEIIG